MKTSPNFIRGRSITFSFIIFLCLLWVIALSVIVFSRWDLIDRSEKSFLAVMLVINTLTIITLPILIILDFKAYLDAARVFLLLVAHIGVAGFFTAWLPAFQCPASSKERNTCRSINVYIAALSYVVPGFFLFYAVCLGIFSYVRYMNPVVEETSTQVSEPKLSEESNPPTSTPATRPEWDRLPPPTPTSAGIIPSPYPFWNPHPPPPPPPPVWYGVPPSPTRSVASSSIRDKPISRPKSLAPTIRGSRQYYVPPNMAAYDRDRRPRPPSSTPTARSSRQTLPIAPGGGDRMSHLSQLVIMSSAARSDAASSAGAPSPTEESRRKRLTKSPMYFTPV